MFGKRCGERRPIRGWKMKKNEKRRTTLGRMSKEGCGRACARKSGVGRHLRMLVRGFPVAGKSRNKPGRLYRSRDWRRMGPSPQKRCSITSTLNRANQFYGRVKEESVGVESRTEPIGRGEKGRLTLKKNHLQSIETRGIAAFFFFRKGVGGGKGSMNLPNTTPGEKPMG